MATALKEEISATPKAKEEISATPKAKEEISATPKAKAINAETVTNIATSFLKRIGNKSGLKPKRVSAEEGVHVVEIEMKKLKAIVRVDTETHEIKEYEIQFKEEEVPMASISPRLIMIIFGISAAVYVALNYAFETFGFPF